MIFEDKKCVEISIPRTATTQRYVMINKLNFDNTEYLENCNKGRYGYRKRKYKETYNFFTHGHFSYNQWTEFIKQNKKYENYFTFSFVRNPYKRFLSMWYSRCKIDHGRTLIFIEPTVPNVLNYIKELLQEYETQTFYLTNENKDIKVDFVGRLENYKNDYDKLKTIVPTLPPYDNRVLRQSVPSSCTETPDLSTKAREIVYEHFKDDFEILGYEK